MKSKTLILTILLLGNTLLAQTYKGKLGYAVSPQGHPHDYSKFGLFLQEVAHTCNGGIVMANGNWRDQPGSEGIIPTLQRTVSSLQPGTYAYGDMLVFAWATYPILYLNNPSNSTNNWSNTQTRDLFLQTLLRTVDSLAPAYLFIGNEVNFYLTQDSADYANWVSFYHMAYDSIKAHQSITKVGTIFNYEHLSGKGVHTGWNTPHWNALKDMDTAKMDMVGLTLYPFFSYPHAQLVPADYLDTLIAFTGSKPLVITETGWPGDSLFGSWYASAQEQVNWINKLFSILNNKNTEVVNWLFLNYMKDSQTTPDVLMFKSVSLRDSSGNDRPALQTWLSYCNTTGVTPEKEEGFSGSIFPNPFKEEATLQTSKVFTNAILTIFNTLGEVVALQDNLSGSFFLLKKNHLAAGAYFYRLSEKDHTLSGKFFIE